MGVQHDLTTFGKLLTVWGREPCTVSTLDLRICLNDRLGDTVMSMRVWPQLLIQCRYTILTCSEVRIRQQKCISCSYSVRDNSNLKSNKYVCITTYQPDTTSNPNPNPNSNPTTKQHETLNIQLNIVTCPTYPEKFIRDMLLHRLCDLRL